MDYRGEQAGALQPTEWRTALIDGATFRNKPVQYAVVDGRAMFEGDIVLGTVDELEKITAEQQARTTGDEPVPEQAVVITGSQFRWPNAVIPYDIDSAMPDQARVTDAIAHWEANTHLQFPLRTAANASQYPNYIHFFQGSDCSSPVGMRGGRQDISLGSGCLRGQAIHEIGHSVGLYHEQSREDRDRFVTINFANIDPTKVHNFDQHISDGDDVGGYDYGSIMHYPRDAFTINDRDTIVPVTPGVTIGQRNGLSGGDIAAVRSMYPPPIDIADAYSGVFRSGSDGHYLWLNVPLNQFLAKWRELAAQGLRLVDIEADVSGNQVLWSGVWRSGNDGYYLWVNANLDSFLAKWQELAPQGLRLVSIEAYPVGGQTLWAGVWRTGNDPYYLWVNASLDNFLAKWQELSQQNLRLVSIEAYPVGNQVLWAGAWRAGSDAHYLWVNANLDNFLAKWRELADQGLRLTTFKTYVAGGNRLWAGVWRAGSDGYALWANANFDNFVAKWRELSAQNLRLISLQRHTFGAVFSDQPAGSQQIDSGEPNANGLGVGGGDVGTLLAAVGVGEGGGDAAPAQPAVLGNGHGVGGDGTTVDPVGVDLGRGLGGDGTTSDPAILGNGRGGGDIGLATGIGHGGGSDAPAGSPSGYGSSG